LRIVFRQGIEVRARSDDPQSKRFPIIDDMRAEGVTDYIALPLLFADGSVQASSWTTKQPGGFVDAQLNSLRSLVPPLARVAEIIQLRRTAVMLLDTYVGNRAGERIMGGQIRRGHTETMNAAIWLSDLRGFTALSDRLPAETVVDILNHYFDCQVASIRAHGGEVLKYMGDGLLAVFPIDEYVDDAQKVCSRVFEAARESRASVAEMHYPIGEAVERFRFGVALHVGKILYGNIGGGNRLDFTCIGPAVNLAARLEKIASRLNRTIVASEEFARICSGGWSDLGEFPIAGFSKAERVYGLMDEAPAA
jgi:adenylate cyclase